MNQNLTKENAFVFRITHIENVAWILEHGLHCRNSTIRDPNFRTIGDPDLIDKRNGRIVKVPPGGTLSDYVPFYFTPFSPMLLKIKSGRGVPVIPMEEIVIFATSLPHLVKMQTNFLYTDRHAYLETANYFNDLSHLDQIDWPILAERDFQRDPNKPDKFERYQAEALVHQHVPVSTLLAIICYCPKSAMRLDPLLRLAGLSFKATVNPKWFF